MSLIFFPKVRNTISALTQRLSPFVTLLLFAGPFVYLYHITYYYPCFYFSPQQQQQDGEPVEFTAFTDERGRLKAQRVTGPMGSFVQGAPRRSFGRALGGGPPADAGFGISGSSPFGNSGFGDTSTTFGNADAVPQMPAMDATTPETTTTAASEDASSSPPSEDAEKKEESTTTSSTTSTTTTTV